MDIMKMLSDLRSEQSRIEEAILVLERPATGQGKRRGRPPKWMSQLRAPKKRTVSSETQKPMAAAQHA